MNQRTIITTYAVNIMAAIKATHRATAEQKAQRYQIAPLMPIRSAEFYAAMKG